MKRECKKAREVVVEETTLARISLVLIILLSSAGRDNPAYLEILYYKDFIMVFLAPKSSRNERFRVF